MLKKEILAYCMWLIALLFLFLQYFLQFSSGIMAHSLMHSFTLTPAGAGLLVGSYYYVYVLCQTPAGFLTDRYGPKKLLFIGGLICCVGSIIFATTNNFITAEFARLLMGGGLSFAFVALVYIIAMWMPAERFTVMLGLAETFVILGVVLCEIYLSSYIDMFGWRAFIYFSAFISLFLVIIVILFLEDRPDGPDVLMEAVSLSDFYSHVKTLFTNPIAWANGMYAGFMFAVLTTFHGFWAQPFFVNVYDVNIITATNYSTMILFGAAFGCPAASWLSSLFSSTKIYMCIAALANTVIFTVILLFTHIPVVILLFLLFMLGFFSGAYVLCFTIAHTLIPAGGKSTSIGFTNTLAVITAPLLQPLIGIILDRVSDINLPHHHHHYSAIEFAISLAVLPACLIIAAILSCYLPMIKKSVNLH